MTSTRQLVPALLRTSAPAVRGTAARPVCARSVHRSLSASTRPFGRQLQAPRQQKPQCQIFHQCRTYSKQSKPVEPKTSSLTFDQVERHVLDINEGADTNTVIIDVREPHELKTTGRIPSAVNIPITSHPDSFHIPADEFRLRFGFDRPALDKKLIVYCKAGVRSRAAKAMALDAGFEHVHDYPGSWLDWAKNTDDIQK
ncbi:hypothetical protein MGG_06046 [Pyricularia oryzae 70-15]|uniref:Rhodanese domain-containing protein n=1 Tax=Pyricularia oryzae (strain 70-15 / ATCC MYA-4617 / FGSC 8958) TaxID=242507 RepID=G4N4X8_PYRO7|nr:uncharacterized protein MGG_06046 [Pyricularia oryzae 70-15]EHA52090.1 hypothetical protein MGG_06046 [Pyricularia oryzae 70-15]